MVGLRLEKIPKTTPVGPLELKQRASEGSTDDLEYFMTEVVA